MDVSQRGKAPIHAMMPDRKMSFLVMIGTSVQSVKNWRKTVGQCRWVYGATPALQIRCETYGYL